LKNSHQWLNREASANKPPWLCGGRRWHQIELASVGGPVVKSSMFFFSSVYGRRVSWLACVVACLFMTAGPAKAQSFFATPEEARQEKETAPRQPQPWQERGLRAALADASPRVRSHAVREITGNHWVRLFFTLKDLRPMLRSADDPGRDTALVALAQLGPEAAPCIGEIVPLLHHESSSVRQSAVEALVQDADDMLRDAAMKALGSLGRVAAPTVVPLLQPLLADTLSAEERDAAKHPPRGENPFATPNPAEDRAYKKNQIRCAAVWALGGMGPESAPQVLPLLLPLLQDEDSSVQSAARRVVASLKGESSSDGEKDSLKPFSPGPDGGGKVAEKTVTLTAAELLKSLLLPLQDPDPAERAAATKALAEAGLKTPAQIISLLLPMLKDADGEVVLAAAGVVRQMGEAAAPFVNDVLPLLQDSDPKRQIHVMYALSKMGDATAPVVAQALLPLLKSADFKVKTVAVNNLGWMGAAAAPVALPALLPLLQGEDSGVRDRVVIALGNMGAGAAPAVKVLVSLLTDPDPEVQRPAAEALGRLGPTAIPIVVPALLAAFTAEDSLLGYHIQLAFEHLGRAAAPLTLATALASYPKTSEDVQDYLCSVIDPWGNFTRDPAWQCAALATALPAPTEKKQAPGTGKAAKAKKAQQTAKDNSALRFHLYLWSGHGADLLLSVRWLGKPSADPMPAQGLSAAEQQAVLGMLLKLWPHSAPHAALRREMAGRIAQVAHSITPAPDEAVTALLKSLDAQLKADAIQDSQEASAKARAVLEDALARKKAG
jgi:HEAT repeat protein